MILQDDRTVAERTSHIFGVVGTDPFMSGWGGAEGGTSYAIWACTPEDVRRVEDKVERRGDMLRVRVVELATYRPRAQHVHIYVANMGTEFTT